jgi:hypothetical protein
MSASCRRPGLGTSQHTPQLGNGKVCWHLLQVPLDAGLGFVFHEHACGTQHVGVQLGLAWAIAPHGIDVHAGAQQVSSEDGGIGLVSRDGGDDVHASLAAQHGLCGAGAHGDMQA